MSKKSDIAKIDTEALQPLEQIENLIHVIRGKQVMLDRDLARLYGVETKVLNQAVKRNIERFPEDFMFQLSKEEFEDWKSQFVTSNYEDFLRSQFATSNDFSTSQVAILNADSDNLKSQIATSNGEKWKSQIVTSNSIKMGARKLPYAFTENGVAMLSSVLRTPLAISTNIQIMRAFTASRHFWASNAQMFKRLEVIEHNQLALGAHQEELSAHLTENDRKLEEVFRRLDNGSAKPTQGIFYDGQVFDAYTFVNDRIREAKKRIVLIDNYVDDSVLKMLDKRDKGVTAKIYSKLLLPQINVDIAKHNAQYEPIEVELFDRAHDRFLCVDDTVYHIGASLKDLGKKWFAFSKMEMTTDELLKKI